MSPCLRSSNRKCVRLSEAESYQLNMYSNVKKPIQFNLDLYCLSVTRRESMAWESSKCIFVSELVCNSSSLSLCLFVSFFLSFIYLSRSLFVFIWCHHRMPNDVILNVYATAIKLDSICALERYGGARKRERVQYFHIAYSIGWFVSLTNLWTYKLNKIVCLCL